jgi:hypothetical protein
MHERLTRKILHVKPDADLHLLCPFGVTNMNALGDFSNSKHAYELGTNKGRVTVYANSRAQARKIAEREGLEVRDVNMVG